MINAFSYAKMLTLIYKKRKNRTRKPLWRTSNFSVKSSTSKIKRKLEYAFENFTNKYVI